MSRAWCDLTQPIRGHLRFLGDVTVGIPLPLPLAAQQAPGERDERRGELAARPDDAPSLDVHVAGESLFRLDLSGGCDFGYAANATIGLGVSIGPLGLMYDFGGSSMYLDIGGASFPSCYPELLAIAMVQNRIELGPLPLNCAMDGDQITCTDAGVLATPGRYFYVVQGLNAAGAAAPSARLGAYVFALAPGN